MGIIPSMSAVLSKIRPILWIWILSSGLLACGNASPTPGLPGVPTSDLHPYNSPTAVPASPTTEKPTTIPRTPDPTTTPFAHTIERGDTMLGIAIRYGVEVEDLQAVNPGVDPNMLSIGTQLIIPLGDEVKSSITTPTPIPISLRTPDCHKTGDGGAWCFVLIENDLPYALENVSARIGLFPQQGNDYTEKIAFPPLNRIGPGDRLPVMAFFPPPIPALFTAKAELLTAVAVPVSSNRYIDADVEINDIRIQANGQMATVQGRILFPDSMVYPSLVWLTAVAFGEDGKVIGIRKWEAVFPSEAPALLSTGTPEILVTDAPISILPVSFQIDVYSLGPAIEQVEVMIEARP